MFPTNSEKSEDLWAEDDLRYDQIGRRSFGFIKDAMLIGQEKKTLRSSAAWLQQSIIEEQVHQENYNSKSQDHSLVDKSDLMKPSGPELEGEKEFNVKIIKNLNSN